MVEWPSSSHREQNVVVGKSGTAAHLMSAIRELNFAPEPVGLLVLEDEISLSCSRLNLRLRLR